MPSYTLQAVTQAPVILPNDRVFSNPGSAEAWFESLPPAARANLEARLTQIVRRMPAAMQLALQRYIVSTGHANPIPSGVDGMGHFHTTSVRTSRSNAVAGLGQWGAIISGVIGAAAQTGASLYTAHEQKDLAKDLQSNALANDRVIQEAALAAQKETQLALIAAQAQAAQIAGAASIGRANAYAPVIASSMKWIGIAVAAAALVGGGVWAVRRKKK